MCSELSQARKDLDAAQKRTLEESNSKLRCLEDENKELLETIKTIMSEVRFLFVPVHPGTSRYLDFVCCRVKHRSTYRLW